MSEVVELAPPGQVMETESKMALVPDAPKEEDGEAEEEAMCLPWMQFYSCCRQLVAYAWLLLLPVHLWVTACVTAPLIFVQAHINKSPGAFVGGACLGVAVLAIYVALGQPPGIVVVATCVVGLALGHLTVSCFISLRWIDDRLDVSALWPRWVTGDWTLVYPGEAGWIGLLMGLSLLWLPFNMTSVKGSTTYLVVCWALGLVSGLVYTPVATTHRGKHGYAWGAQTDAEAEEQEADGV